MSEAAENLADATAQAAHRAAQPSLEAVSAGERILGALALIVAIGVALIAVDLISGGRAWAQWLPGRAEETGE